MREYITVIAGTAILSVLADIVSPENWKKYIKIVTGLVIACVIIQPAAEIRNIDVFDAFSSFESDFEYKEYDPSEKIIDELCMKLKDDIKTRIYEKSGENIECDVKLSFDDNGLIKSVDKIYIYGSISDSTRRELAYIYGMEIQEVVVYGE